MLQACLLGGRNKNQDTAMRPQNIFIFMAIANENQPPGCVSEHVPALRRYCLPFCVHRKCFRPFAPLGKLISSVFAAPPRGGQKLWSPTCPAAASVSRLTVTPV